MTTNDEVEEWKLLYFNMNSRGSENLGLKDGIYCTGMLLCEHVNIISGARINH
jgi:hypothetical protein